MPAIVLDLYAVCELFWPHLQQLLCWPMDVEPHLWESAPVESLRKPGELLEDRTLLSSSTGTKQNPDFHSFWSKYYDQSERDSHSSSKTLSSQKDGAPSKTTSSDSAHNTQLSDILLSKVIQMMIPTNVEPTQVISQRLTVQSTRPPLSMNVMSNNSTLMALRLSYPFQCMDAVTIFFSWTEPNFTVAVLLVATHLLLKPELILALPGFLMLTNVLVPYYMARHPPDNSLQEILGRNPIPAEGEPLLPCLLPKPVPQFSQEFLLNLTDMQNHQLEYVAMYDFFVWLTKDYLYFKDENVSCLLYLGLLGSLLYNVFFLPKVMLFVWNHLPIKFMLVVQVWAVTAAFHPVIKNRILNLVFDERTRIAIVSNNNHLETYLIRLLIKEDVAREEVREVEIFELQKLLENKIWEPIGFVNEVFTINNPTRRTTENLEAVIENDDQDDDTTAAHIDHCVSLDQIKSPLGWKFVSKWMIDIDPTGWVCSRIIQDVVNIDSDEKWVYDAMEANGMFRRRRWIRQCCRKK